MNPFQYIFNDGYWVYFDMIEHGFIFTVLLENFKSFLHTGKQILVTDAGLDHFQIQNMKSIFVYLQIPVKSGKVFSGQICHFPI